MDINDDFLITCWDISKIADIFLYLDDLSLHGMPADGGRLVSP